jgi:hypothetical protein
MLCGLGRMIQLNLLLSEVAVRIALIFLGLCIAMLWYMAWLFWGIGPISLYCLSGSVMVVGLVCLGVAGDMYWAEK